MSEEKKVLDEQEAENVTGGSGYIRKVICCTCGHEIKLNAPMYTEYYNKNVCPICKGRLKSW